MKFNYGFAALFLSLCIVNSSVAAEEMPARINSQGVGEIEAMPDMAYLNGSIRMQAKTAEEAMRKVRDSLHTLTQWCLSKGIDRKDLRAAQVRIQERWEYPKGGPRRSVGFEGFADVRIVLRDLSTLSFWYQSLPEQGITGLNPARFDFSNREQLEVQALQAAALQAKDRAAAVASALGVSLDKVRHVDLQPSASVLPMQGVAMAMDSGESSKQMNVGEQVIRATVRLSYDLK